MKERLPEIFLKIYLTLALGYLFAPVVSLVAFSFGESRIQSFPIESFSLKWYQRAWQDASFREGLWMSARIALLVAPLSTLLGLISAHFLCRRTPRRPLMYVAIVSLPAFIPLLLSGMAMLIYYREIYLVGTLWAIVVAHVCYCSPFALVIIYLAYQSLNIELEQAARNLGATTGRVMFMIVLPQLWPALLAAGAISFLISWDEFILAWFVGGFTKTLPTVIYASLGTSFDPSVNAIGTAVTLVSVLLLLGAMFLLRRVLPRTVNF